MKMTRREWIATGLAVATPVFGNNRIDRSRLSAITDEIGRTPGDAIAFVKQYGLRWVELRNVPGAKDRYDSLPEAAVRAAAREFSAHGLKVSFLNTGILKHVLPGTEPADSRGSASGAAEVFANRLEILRRAINAAHILGVDKVRIFAFRRVKDPIALMPRIADIIGEMAEIAAREKVQLLVENEASCNVATCLESVTLLKLLPSRWIGLNWDPLNGARYKEPPFPDGYSMLPKDRIGNVQIKGRSILPGPETLDWAAIFDALARDGYRGQCGLETHIFGDGQIQASHDSMKAILRIVEPS
jgi:sugar phosphate isomerase/epimerase